MNKLQWNFDRNSNIFIHENAFESVVCEMAAAMLSRPQCVNAVKEDKVIAQSPAYGNVSNDRNPFDKRDLVKAIIITWLISVPFSFQWCPPFNMVCWARMQMSWKLRF